MNENVEYDLKEVWKVELEILDEIDQFCKTYHLKYSLVAGTLLGAVRHKGFIPWDDDIDIIMPREDYEKLLSLWKSNGPDGFILQNKFTDWDFTQNFTKIRKDHTTFIHSKQELNVSYHTGIFVDIFPGDRIAKNPLFRKAQIGAAAINLLYSRGFTSKSGGIQELIEKFFLSFPLKIKKKMYKWSSEVIQKWNHNLSNEYFFPNTIESVFKLYPSNTFNEMKEIFFENRLYMCVEDTDRILSIEYGNYMTLPPVEERVLKHHPIILDTAHNLDELQIDLS